MAAQKFTILGSTGFIGRHLSLFLESAGHSVLSVPRDATSLEPYGDLGHVIYAIGLTGGRAEPSAMIEAHVEKLRQFMDKAQFSSWLYLSSTRPYGYLPEGTVACEETPIPLAPVSGQIFDISKLLGEAFCLSHKNPAVRVARLSNVYGADQSPHTFFGSIFRDLGSKGSVTIGESAASGKDYIAIDDAVHLLSQIALHGQERLYNVASGQSFLHGDMAQKIKSMGYDIHFADGGATRLFPRICVDKIAKEFGHTCRYIGDDFTLLAQAAISQYPRQQ